MAADLMAGGVQRTDLVFADHAPMLILAAADAAGDIEGAAKPAPFQDRGAVDESRIRHVVEREADKRPGIVHRVRLGPGVPRGTPQHAFDQRLQDSLHHEALATASGPLGCAGSTSSPLMISRNLSAARAVV